MDKIIDKFQEALNLLKSAQEVDPQLASPSIIVEPMEPIIDKAVKILQRMDPAYFKGARKIVVQTSSAYGQVESGPQKDPTVINININRIKQEAGPESVASAALVIAHEMGHVRSFESEKGFVGGESPAEAEEAKVSQWIKNNINNLKDLLTL